MKKTSLYDFVEQISSFNSYKNERSGDNSQRLKKIKQMMLQVIENELTGLQKVCLKQYYLENKNMKAISETLNISEATVSRHIKRGKVRIKRILKYYV